MSEKFEKRCEHCGAKVLLRCAFCGKRQDEVKKLIAAVDVCICDECIALSQEILDEESIKPDKDKEEEAQ